MDGEQLRIAMLKPSLLILILTFSKVSLATEESLDLEFLEWLGETAELEEMGLDIDELLQKQDAEGSSEEKSQ